MKILKANHQQLALLESALLSTGKLYLIKRGDNLRTFEVQKEFKSVVVIREYELLTRDVFPVKLVFQMHELDDEMSTLSTNKKGLERLKELLPETFGTVEETDDKVQEIKIEVKPFTRLKEA